MAVWLFLFGGPLIVAVGVWTVLHPDGGYRPVGGAGSGLAPGSRRAAGWALAAFGVAAFATGLAVL